MSKEVQIRAAMERLLVDQAIHTDGRLDVTTLAAEAGISRQDLYRTYRHLLDEFRGHIKRLEDAPGRPDRQGEQIRHLKDQLDEVLGRAARYRGERNEARHQRDINASQVVYLDEQNRLLRQQLETALQVKPIRLDHTGHV